MLSGTRQFAFFGDSISDPGNIFRVTEGLVQDELRFARLGENGRASDGPVFAEHLAPLLGLAPSLNYAVGGAHAAGHETLRDYVLENGYSDQLLVDIDDPRLLFDRNLGAQIDRFAADTAGRNVGQVTAFVLIGGNDYGDIDPSDPLGEIGKLAGALLSSVQATLDAAWDLTSMGVDQVIVSGLPSAGFLPSIASQSASIVSRVDDLIDQHNGLLKSGVDLLDSLGRDVAFFDLGRITQAFVDDASQFGILAPHDLTLRGGAPAALAAYDPSQVGFWDSIHPSAATHAVLGGWLARDGSHVTLGAGADSRQLGTADDTVLAYGGADTIWSSGGDDLVFAGSGDDIVRLGNGEDLGSGGQGQDRLQGGPGRDTLAGGPGDDLVIGGRGNDILIDGPGDDTLRGNRDDDTFVFFDDVFLGGADAGQNLFAGAAGRDRLILVLDADGAAGFDRPGPLKSDLAALGITAYSIETVTIVTGRAGLAAELAASDWYDTADLWGLI
ncbi:SGNH/GDSL hydrolase family protein [Sedimentitalea sp. HM32M-2]|uniref:SGNH/GDSL hydrolase family protein n=1 Tax=Sedimentitalea sp. HM32M-2 TaxID=3351566 RepID=UPI003635B84A